MSILKNAKEIRRVMPEGLAFNRVQSEGVIPGKPVPIRYAFQIGRDDLAKGTVIFLPGRTEFIEKFYEDMHIWNAFGYQAAGIDLRGQGLSFRPGKDRGRHYIDSFDHHVPDVDLVLETLEKAGAPKPFHLMAHSAGSHVSLRYLHDMPMRIKSAFLVAPMVGIANGGLPPFLVKGLPSLLAKIGLGQAYVPGHKGIKLGEWGWRKQLTHDLDRFEDEDFFINTVNADFAVGGATYRWVFEALKSCALLQSPGYAELIKTPFHIFQAGKEGIVDNSTMSDFVARSKTGRLHIIDGAKHEILKETDDKRRLIWLTICKEMGFDKNAL